MINLENIVDDVCVLYDIDVTIDQSFREKLLDYISERYYDDSNLTEDELIEILGDYIDQIVNGIETTHICEYSSSANDDIYNLSNEALIELYFNCDVSLKKKISEIILQKNEKFIYKMAKRFYQSNYDDFEDLLQAGRLGMFESLSNYDLNKAKGTFVNFSSYYIKCYMFRLRKVSRNLAISYSDYYDIGLLNRARADLYVELGRTPTIEELADRMDMDTQAVNELLLIEKDTSSLNLWTNDDEMIDLMDVYADPNGFDILEYVERESVLESLDSVLDSVLNDKEAFVVKYILGFVDNSEHTLNESVVALSNYRGDGLTLTHQRISQIFQKGIEKLKQSPKFLNWALLVDGDSKRINNVNMLDDEIGNLKVKFRSNRQHHRKLMRSGINSVSLLEYYMCTQEVLDSVIFSLSDVDRLLFDNTIGSCHDCMNFSLLQRSDVQTLDKKISGRVNNIMFDNLSFSSKELKLLKKC
ncbi:MAG: hypothetical protein J6B89_00580 [Bacilli bacterium]|nr:hypothetical protein [Bacilli bacterium]